MPLPKEKSRYTEVEQKLNAALLDPVGIKLKLPSHGHAIRWRMKAYYLRKLVKEESKEIFKDARTPEERAKWNVTPWDDLVLKVEGEYVIIERETDDVLESISLSTGEEVAQPEMTDTETLDTMTGPPAPLTFDHSTPLDLDIPAFDQEAVDRAKRELADFMKKGQ